MTKSELAKKLADKEHLTIAKAELIVNIVFDSMVETLEKNQRVEIRGFGTFVNRYYKRYKGRNPRSGDVVYVESKRVPFFKAGKELKKLINTKR